MEWRKAGHITKTGKHKTIAYRSIGRDIEGNCCEQIGILSNFAHGRVEL